MSFREKSSSEVAWPTVQLDKVNQVLALFGEELSPAYDLLSVLLTGINDLDELAMPLSGLSEEDAAINGFNRTSSINAMTSTGIAVKVAERILDKLTSCRDKWFAVIESSFLDGELKNAYKTLLAERLTRLCELQVLGK